MYVPDHLKKQDMCERAVCFKTNTLEHVPDNLKTQEMCDKVVHHGPWQLKDVPYHLKIEEMYKELLKIPATKATSLKSIRQKR